MAFVCMDVNLCVSYGVQTCQTPAVGGLIVCESVCPMTCRHIARRMMNG